MGTTDFVVSTLSFVIVTNNLQHCTKVFILKEHSEINKYLYKCNKFSCFPSMLENGNDKYVLRFKNVTRSEDFEHYNLTIPKFRESCVVIFIPFVTSYANELDTHITNLDNRLFRKNRDYFLFYTSFPTNHDIIFQNIRNNLFIKFSENDTVSLYSICELCINSRVTVSVSKPSFPGYFNNFNKKNFRVSHPTSVKAVSEIRQVSPNEWKLVRGYVCYMFKHLMNRYNFTATFFSSSVGGGTGYKFPNGTWIGAVADILSGEADIGQIAAQIQLRNDVVDFASPIGYEWLSFVTGVGQPHYSWRSIYRPLSLHCWLMTLVSAFISLVVCQILMNTDKTSFFSCSNFSKTANYLFRTVLEQNGKCPGTSSPVRIFLVAWLFVALVTGNAYRSKLVTFLAFPVFEEPPKTFDELAASSHYQATLYYSRGAAHLLLSTSKNPTFQTIFRRLRLEENPVKCFGAAVEIESHQTCIAWSSYSDYLNHRNFSSKSGKAPFKTSEDVTSFLVLTLMFRKGAIYQEEFNWVIRWSVNMGLTQKWRRMDNVYLLKERLEWMEPNTIENTAKETSTLKMENLMGTFYIILFGEILSLFAFGIEIIMSWLNVRRGNVPLSNFIL